MIAARARHTESMNIVKQLFLRGGDVMKDDHEQSLSTYKKQQDKMKSDMRDKAVVHFALQPLW